MTDDMPSITHNSIVSLREVTAETVRAICRLEVSEEQKHLVAPNAVSIAQAYFEPKAWFRAIYADDTPVGFVMLYDDPDEPEYFLWRFMIDGHYQKMGFGKHSLDLLAEYVQGRPEAHELKLSCVPGDDGPEPFYRKYGFVLTGRMLDNEAEMSMQLPLK